MSLTDDERTAAALIDATLADAIAWHECARHADPAPILSAAAVTIGALEAGGKLLVFGNGGSAADAQHVAAELVGRFQRDRAAIAAIALTTDTSILTSVGNDLGYEQIFARQIEALGRSGDVALAISTSGMSSNVVAGLAAARRLGLRTVALTGCDGGDVGRASEIHVNVPAQSTARVQEVHRTLLHVICDLIERALSERVR